jgi:hypothetical protein
MRNFTIYLALILCLCLSKLTAQETFESRAKTIAAKIDAITKEEKAALKIEIEEVNKQLDAGKITHVQADDRKVKFAEIRAKNIETRSAAAQEELGQLVQDRVDGKIKDKDSTNTFLFRLENKNISRHHGGEARTTSQFVLAGGLNNVLTNGQLAHSDFGIWRSAFWEWGITLNTRLSNQSNLLHLKYGLTWVYNCLSATEDRYFVEHGDQTVLEPFGHNLKAKETYFKNVFITLPVHLEFDFSKNEVNDDGTHRFKSHQGFRLGLGGFVGYNTNSKQFLSYEDEYNHDVKLKQKGDWNIPDWNYGLSTYFGYKETSIYLKYDLNPMFKDNAVDVRNISLGLRFDLN